MNAQENIEELYPKTTTTNLTPPIFGEPIYRDKRQSSNSIVLNDDSSSIQTQNSCMATGILKDVGNVTDKSTFITHIN